MSENRQKKPVCKTLSAAAFAVLWLAVCTVTSAAALKLPLNRLINREMIHQNDKISNDFTVNTDISGGPVSYRYKGHAFKGELGSETRLYDNGNVERGNHHAGFGSDCEEMTAPVAHLCNFVTTGDVDELFKAIHPKQADYLKNRFGTVIAVLKGSGILTQQLAGELLKPEMNISLDEIIRLEYEIKNAEKCGEDETVRILNESKAWTDKLSLHTAWKIELQFTAYTEAGIKPFVEKLLVFQTDEGWFIDIGSTIQNVLSQKND